MYRIINWLAIIFFVCLVSGCATSYSSRGLFSHGFEEKQLSADSYQVSFEGNEITTLQDTYQYAMRRCAELAAEKGYDYFVVINKKTRYLTSSYDTQYGNRSVTEPNATLTIQFTKTKVTGAYTVKKVLANTVAA